jgi:hypothetical protein
MSSSALRKTPVTKPCACGCGAEVEIDGFGTALSASEAGVKVFFATLGCQKRYETEKPP